MALRPVQPAAKRSSSKTRGPGEGPANPQPTIPPAERAKRKADATMLAALDIDEGQAVQQLIDQSAKRAEISEGGFRAFTEENATRYYQAVRKEILDKPLNAADERKLQIAALKATLPNILGKGRYGDALKYFERLARLQGLDAKISVSVDVTNREAILAALGLSTPEELDEMVKRGIAREEQLREEQLREKEE